MRRIAHFLAQPLGLFFALPWLMVLVLLGTLAQRYIGLYASQKLFFGSFILWAGAVPLPGAYSVILFIAASLLAKLLCESPISLRRSGIILAHISVVVLLLGGLITALNREDGYIVLGDGQSAQAVSDYRQRALAVTEDGKQLEPLAYGDMRAGAEFQKSSWPFAIRILRTCFPCAVAARAQPETALRGVATKLALVNVPYSKEDAQNAAGVEYAVIGSNSGADGTYIAFEGLAAPEALAIGKRHFTLALKPLQRLLPFALRLRHFTKTDYPGTDEARAYRSDVMVKDGALEWPAAIEMNQPLRYKGYTVYQSSFVEDGGRLLSVLAVVKNAGDWFPYIALSLLIAGLGIHLGIVLWFPSP